jgi:hypothetical protein
MYPKKAKGIMHEPIPTIHKVIDSDIFHLSVFLFVDCVSIVVFRCCAIVQYILI